MSRIEVKGNGLQHSPSREYINGFHSDLDGAIGSEKDRIMTTDNVKLVVSFCTLLTD